MLVENKLMSDSVDLIVAPFHTFGIFLKVFHRSYSIVFRCRVFESREQPKQVNKG
jgi:hypothetical protein